MRIALYPGTFDPITLGHEDLLRRAAQLFDRVVLAVAVAHHKKTLFSLDERLELAHRVTADWDLPIQILPFDGLLADFVRAQRGQILVRGLRAVTDFDYEFQMAGMNRHLLPEVETVFLTPGPAFQFVSSTLVREIALLGGDVSGLVSAPVLAALQRQHAQRAHPHKGR